MGGVVEYITKAVGGGKKQEAPMIPVQPPVAPPVAGTEDKDKATTQLAKRTVGRARGAGTIFTSSLGYGGAASIARKQLLGE